jgi:tetratricopeptide (TPR) repeat protein
MNVRRPEHWLAPRTGRALLAGVLSLIVAAGARAESRADEALHFADHLFSQGQYYRAVTEYERFLFLAPTDARAPRARLRIGLSYLEGGEYDTAFEVLDNLCAGTKATEIARRARAWLAGGLYEQGRYPGALGTASKLPVDDDGARELFMGLCYLRLDRADLALKATGNVPAEGAQGSMADLLTKASHELPVLPRKSPTAAAVMSALLPGSGQLYVRRYQDAAWAFLLNGACIGAGIHAFHNDEPVAGAIAVLLELIWYSGNVYNAANGAHKYNALTRETFFDDLDRHTFLEEDGPLFRVFLQHTF